MIDCTRVVPGTTTTQSTLLETVRINVTGQAAARRWEWPSRRTDRATHAVKSGEDRGKYAVACNLRIGM